MTSRMIRRDKRLRRAERTPRHPPRLPNGRGSSERGVAAEQAQVAAAACSSAALPQRAGPARAPKPVSAGALDGAVGVAQAARGGGGVENRGIGIGGRRRGVSGTRALGLVRCAGRLAPCAVMMSSRRWRAPATAHALLPPSRRVRVLFVLYLSLSLLQPPALVPATLPQA